MPTPILDILSSTYSSTRFEGIIKKEEFRFNELMEIALQNHAPASWRATFICHHQTSNNDPLLIPYLERIVAALPNKKDGHQRELMRLLLKSEINEELEGKLFDSCVTIWEAVEKSSSVRIIAFKVIAQIAAKYPEMKNEITFLTENQYIDSLSPGIKRSVVKIIKVNKLD